MPRQTDRHSLLMHVYVSLCHTHSYGTIEASHNEAPVILAWKPANSWLTTKNSCNQCNCSVIRTTKFVMFYLQINRQTIPDQLETTWRVVGNIARMCLVMVSICISTLHHILTYNVVVHIYMRHSCILISIETWIYIYMCIYIYNSLCYNQRGD